MGGAYSAFPSFRSVRKANTTRKVLCQTIQSDSYSNHSLEDAKILMFCNQLMHLHGRKPQHFRINIWNRGGLPHVSVAPIQPDCVSPAVNHPLDISLATE